MMQSSCGGRRRLNARPWFSLSSPRELSRGVVVVFCLALLSFRSASAGESVSFNRDIRSILSEHCYACHGPDAKTRKAGLRLDQEDGAKAVLSSGKTAIVPGKPEESELVARILTDDPDDRMPPAETKKPLSDEKIALLRQWIAEGAKFEGHWAYITPQRPEAPVTSNDSWARSDVDRFILARLESEGLQPTAEAPKEKLLRRVTLDLTGLPPTVEELDAFLADGDEKAYEKVVDRLLGSPQYGERMAQQWLDLARYGETQGYHHDRHRDMWHWRDWVIDAFNKNMPFDQFTIEQLAGDLLPEPTREQLVATGFHRNEMTTSEGGALPEEYIVKYAVGRVDTTARVWLGTSMACAECHDHKFDPISQKEYYRFFAFFYNTPENGLDAEELNPQPRITLESAEDRSRGEQMDREVAALQTAEELLLSASRTDWDADQDTWEKRHRKESLAQWTPLKLIGSHVGYTDRLEQREDQAVSIGAAAAGSSTYELTFKTDATGLNGLRLETLPRVPAPGSATSSNKSVDGPVLSRVEVQIRSLDPAKEVFTDDPVVLETWSSVGPFPAGSPKEAFDKEFGPEKNSDLKASFGDAKLRWTERSDLTEGGRIELEGTNTATYLTRVLRVTKPRVVEATLGSDEGVRVWLNDRSLLAQGASRSAAPDQDRVRLWLRPGENRLLIKVVQGAANGGLYFRLLPDAVVETSLELAAVAADSEVKGRPAKGVLDEDPGTGWSAADSGSAHSLFLRPRETFGFQGGTELRVRLSFGGGAVETNLAAIRLAVAAGSTTLAEFIDLPAEVRAALMKDADSLTDGEKLAMRKFYRGRFIEEVRQAQQLLATRRKQRDEFRQSWPTAMVMREAMPTRETHLLIRGQYNNPGEKVDPGVPTHLFPWSDGLPANRLGLAKWLMDPRHPLTSRVVVNQYWQRLFGTGLVKTSEDFGSQGDWPSHPELLDWLATEFIRTGWDVKPMHRLIVTSSTYRQDSIVTPTLRERDPENRLLARGPRFRLDAENIRDVAMAAGGLLNSKVGGPSVFPYQPPGLWGQVSFEGTRDYVQSTGPENYRRGLYTYWRRSIPYAAFTIFDAPSREVCVIRRPRTNTPLQALALLNDPVYIEAARGLAQRLLKEGGSTAADRIRYAFRLVLGRSPSEAEVRLLEAACQREFRRFADDREAANRLIHVGASTPTVEVDIAELAAWTVVANTLLNLDETITKG